MEGLKVTLDYVPLLATKLHAPPPRPNLVVRPRLIELLNKGLSCKLILISAPPGFGKTTLVSEWLTTCEHSAAWLSLDVADNDPVRFLGYLTRAFEATASGFAGTTQSLLHSPQPPPAESILAVMINDLCSLDQDVILVLDDYHVITAPLVHRALTLLLDRMPSRMHLVVSTRQDPPLPLARLRSQNQLVEIRAEELRFTPVETRLFLKQVMALDLPERESATLEERTEGWVAGLQMAALSLRGRTDIPQFIRSFSGSHRFILDYLIEEVLSRQPDNVRSFLIQTSVLGRLTGPLCDAVTGREDSRAMLENLERSNLFLMALDDERCWYRYHHLFADLLLAHLRQTQPDSEAALHARAAQWYEAHHLIAEAIDHALCTQDYGRVIRLLEQSARSMVLRGEIATVLSWVDSLPRELISSSPWLCTDYAWALVLAGHHDEVERLLQDVEGWIHSHPGVQANRHRTESLVGNIAAIRAFLALYSGDVARGVQQATLAQDHLPQSDPALRSTVAYLLAGAYGVAGALAKACELLDDVVATERTAGNTWFTIVATGELAALLRVRGQLRRAVTLYREGLQLAVEQGGQHFPLIGALKAGMGDVFREWNDLEAANQLLEEGIEYNEQGGNPNLLALSYLTSARLRRAQGDWDGALNSLERAEQLAYRYRLPTRTVYLVKSCRANLSLARGDSVSIARVLPEKPLDIEPPLTYLLEPFAMAQARVCAARGEFDVALELLTKLRTDAKAGDRKGSLIEILGLQALALSGQGRLAPAFAALEEAFALAEAEGYVRVYVDEGEPMRHLILEAKKRLERAGGREAAPANARMRYLESLLDAFPQVVKHAVQPSSRLIEPLSERELEVLRWMGQGLSNREIMQKMTVALGTVKAHVHNIYGKLGVKTRTQAIVRARDLNLI